MFDETSTERDWLLRSPRKRSLRKFIKFQNPFKNDELSFSKICKYALHIWRARRDFIIDLFGRSIFIRGNTVRLFLIGWSVKFRWEEKRSSISSVTSDPMAWHLRNSSKIPRIIFSIFQNSCTSCCAILVEHRFEFVWLLARCTT